MSTDASRRSARTAINEELQWLLRQSIPDAVKREVWRIEKLAAVEDDGAALNEIHNKSLDLSGVNVPAGVRKTLELVMSIARYETDTRSTQDKDKHRNA
jgi:hypothetical protein